VRVNLVSETALVLVIDSSELASELLAKIRRRQCRVPTILFLVGTRHCRLLYIVFISLFSSSVFSALSVVKKILRAKIRRRQCRVPTILFLVGTRHCRLLYIVFISLFSSSVFSALSVVKKILRAKIRRRQCRVPTILFLVGTRHCRLLYIVFISPFSSSVFSALSAVKSIRSKLISHLLYICTFPQTKLAGSPLLCFSIAN